MINVAIVGITGFGIMHLNECVRLANENTILLQAVCDLNFSTTQMETLRPYGTRLYTSYEQLLEQEQQLDLIVIATPIHLHAKMAIAAMKAGIHVLVEKPSAAVIQDTIRMIEVSAKTNKRVAVNYTLIAPDVLDCIKTAIYEGKVGKLKSIKAIGLWKRLDSYYDRTAWAGKLTHHNHYVLDGTLNNPFSHLLFNALKLASLPLDRQESTAYPLTIQAELYKAHNIESEDTSCLRVTMSNALELLFYGTLCATENYTPYIEIEGEEGVLTWHYNQLVTLKIENSYTVLMEGERLSLSDIYMQLAEAARGKTNELYCSVEETLHVSQLINGAFESSIKTYPIPEQYISHIPEEDSLTSTIIDIETHIRDCAKQNLLFSEANIAWAQPTTPFELKNYTHFSMNFG